MNDEYRLGSVQLPEADPPQAIEPVAVTAQFDQSEQPVLKPSSTESTTDIPASHSAQAVDESFDFDF